MKSYIKVYGPPVLKGIKALEKVAIGMPEVCIWDTIIESAPHLFNTTEGTLSYFESVGGIPQKRCGNIISKSGAGLGEHDFFFEWFKDPSMDQVNMLIERIDEALAPIGVRYTIMTK